VDLAARAGVTQSVIRAYESGHRQPSIPALARLIGAAGFELTLGLPGRPAACADCQVRWAAGCAATARTWLPQQQRTG
jgi:transcriptional regulator with XRE-family HTH domain